MFIFRIFEGNLSFFFQISELVGVLEHQMHEALHVDLDLNLVLLFEILEFSLFVTKFSLFIFELLLAHHPEVRDSDSLIIVHVSQFIFILDFLLEGTTFFPE